MKWIIKLLALMLTLSTAIAATQLVNPEASATYKDIKATLGIVPTFLKNYPHEGIAGAWLDMKTLQLNPKTALIGKSKELIGLAVSAQIPCRYCTYFHTQAAKLNQATQQEISEAIAIAASTRRWSTIINGSQVPVAQFKDEVDKMMKFTQEMKRRQAMEEPIKSPKQITNSKEAYEDIKQSMGFVPTFLKNYPEGSVTGAWNDMKGIEMNPNTKLSGKLKDLIGLAVSAQIPCGYCVYFHTRSALSQGATQLEINEAIAMAGMTRQWSTVLNGHYTNEKIFEDETNQIMRFLKSKATKTVTQF